MILYIMQSFPQENSQTQDKFNIITKSQKQSALVLLDDAVYLTISTNYYNQLLSTIKDHTRIYAIDIDLIARGLSSNKSIPIIETINYETFVDLTTQYQTIHNWL